MLGSADDVAASTSNGREIETDVATWTETATAIWSRIESGVNIEPACFPATCDGCETLSEHRNEGVHVRLNSASFVLAGVWVKVTRAVSSTAVANENYGVSAAC